MTGDNNQVILVGCGNMGRAMLQGWLDSKVLSADKCYVVEPNDELRQKASALGAQVAASADALPRNMTPSFIILAVKPQVMFDVTPAYEKHVQEGACVISIAAGVKTEKFGEAFGVDAAIARVMPNTPAAISKGMMVIFNNANVTEAQKSFIETLMAASGAIATVSDETMMDAVTAVSGSGPAYIFHMIEALHLAGVEAGLPQDTAKLLAEQTVFGAVTYAKDSDTSPAVLREQVTSPGGTTAAALDVLMNEKDGLSQLMKRAVAAAKKRSEELGS